MKKIFFRSILLGLFISPIMVLGQSYKLPDNLWDLLVTGPYTGAEWVKRSVDHTDNDIDVTEIKTVFGKGYRRVFDAEWVVWVQIKNNSQSLRGTWHKQKSTKIEKGKAFKPEARIPIFGLKSSLKHCKKQGPAMFKGRILVAYRCDVNNQDISSKIYYADPNTQTIVFEESRGDDWSANSEYHNWGEIGPVKVPGKERLTWTSSYGTGSGTTTLESFIPNVPYDQNDYTEEWLKTKLKQFDSRK